MATKTVYWIAGVGGNIFKFENGVWTASASGTANDLYGMWGAASNDLWAVGASGTIIHWNGAAWASVASPTTNIIYDIYGFAADDIYAVTDNNATAGEILHYNGTAWSVLFTTGAGAPAADPIPNIGMNCIWGTDTNNVFIGCDGSGGFGTEGVLYKSGTDWFMDHSAPQEAVTGIYGLNTANIYIGFNSAGVGTVYKGAIGSWASVHSDSNLDLQNRFNTVWVAPNGYVYVAGANSATSDGRLATFNGVTWTSSEPSPANKYFEGVRGFATSDILLYGHEQALVDKGRGWTQFDLGVFTHAAHTGFGFITEEYTPPVNVFVTDNNAGFHKLLLYQGREWWQEPSDGPTPNLTAVWGANFNNVWFVNRGATEGEIWKFDGTDYTLAQSVNPHNLYGIYGQSESDVWFCGSSNDLDTGYATFYHWDGASYTPTVKNGGGDPAGVMRAIVSHADGTAIATGYQWNVWRYNAGAWTSLGSPTTGVGDAYAIWGHTSTDIWIGGDAGIYRWDGATFSLFNAGRPTGGAVYAIHGTADDDIWFGLANGAFEHWNGATFTAHTFATAAAEGTCAGLWAIASDNVWAVGGTNTTWSGGYISNWDGANWADPVDNGDKDRASTLSGVWAMLAAPLSVHKSTIPTGSLHLDRTRLDTATTSPVVVNRVPPPTFGGSLATTERRPYIIFDVFDLNTNGFDYIQVRVTDTSGTTLVYDSQGPTLHANWDLTEVKSKSSGAVVDDIWHVVLRLKSAYYFESEDTITVEVTAVTLDPSTQVYSHQFNIEDWERPTVVTDGIKPRERRHVRVEFSESMNQAADDPTSTLYVRDISGRVSYHDQITINSTPYTNVIHAPVAEFVAGDVDLFIGSIGAQNSLNNGVFQITQRITDEYVKVDASLVAEDVADPSEGEANPSLYLAPYRVVRIAPPENIIQPTFVAVVKEARAAEAETLAPGTDATKYIDLVLHDDLTPNTQYSLELVSITDTSGNEIGSTYTFTSWTPNTPEGRKWDLWQYMIPNINKKQDVSKDLERLVRSIDEAAQVMLADVDAFGNLMDPDSVKEEVLPIMLDHLGNPLTFVPKLSLQKRRDLIPLLVPMYKLKGTAKGIEDAVSFFLGLDVEVKAEYIPADTWMLGVDELGIDTTLGPTSSSFIYSFYIDHAVVLTTEQIEIINEIVEFVRPAHTHFTRYEYNP